MLVIDDNMLKLAKMQEALLKMSTNDRRANLENYKTTVRNIDEQAFSSLLAELSQVSEHNRPLEDELQFMEQVKGYYDQLYELQCSFKRVCELYGDNSLILSDLSQIDYEYIETRLNTINGYLINVKNIEINKERLAKLNEKLVKEEKDSELFVKSLLDYEAVLRNSFVTAEGRTIDKGRLQYVSIVSEYEELGYDFKHLLDNNSEVSELLNVVLEAKKAASEKLQAAELCYNSNPNFESRHILNDIRNDYFSVSYREAMLKILYLLSKDYVEFELFKVKRGDLFDLIEYRSNYLKKLNINFSYDPFKNTKLSEQIGLLDGLSDNSKNISKIKNELVELSERVDEMIKQNSKYMILLNDTRDLLKNEISMSDIDVSDVKLDIEDYVKVDVAVLDNQVVSVKDVLEVFNMDRVRQKTRSVMNRVNEMVISVPFVEEKDDVVIAPELVIVPKTKSVYVEEEKSISSTVNVFEDLGITFNNDIAVSSDKNEDIVEDLAVEKEVKSNEDEISSNTNVLNELYNSDIFETVDPFVQSALFEDRVEGSFEKTGNLSVVSSKELDNISGSDNSDIVLEYTNEMPDAFWVTQDEKKDDNLDVVLTFDEQIDALLGNDTKKKKLAA